MRSGSKLLEGACTVKMENTVEKNNKGQKIFIIKNFTTNVQMSDHQLHVNVSSVNRTDVSNMGGVGGRAVCPVVGTGV